MGNSFLTGSEGPSLNPVFCVFVCLVFLFLLGAFSLRMSKITQNVAGRFEESGFFRTFFFFSAELISNSLKLVTENIAIPHLVKLGCSWRESMGKSLCVLEIFFKCHLLPSFSLPIVNNTGPQSHCHCDEL